MGVIRVHKNPKVPPTTDRNTKKTPAWPGYEWSSFAIRITKGYHVCGKEEKKGKNSEPRKIQ
jgi:hypothetical protein